MFCTCVRSFYGFNTLIFIILNYNSIHHALQLDADYRAVCIRIRDEMVQIRRWFDANCSIFLCEMSLRFVLNHVIVWLSMLCNSLQYGAYLAWGRLSFWILQSIQGNCKVCWKELTYILLLRMWGCCMRSSWIIEKPSPAPPKEGSTSYPRLLKTRNKFVYKQITFISSKIFFDILRCRLRRGGQNCE